MKRLGAGILFLLLALGVLYYRSYSNSEVIDRRSSQAQKSFFETILRQDSPVTSPQSTEAHVDAPRVSVFATGLKVPWALAFLPDGDLLVTEREGRVRLVTSAGEVKPDPVATIAEIRAVGEGGLHGIALHPEFSQNGYVYLYYTYGDSGGNTLNRVSRFTFDDTQLRGEKVIVDSIPGAPNHDGGRIKFGPDGYLYITTGDAQNPSLAQDANSLAGKILRVTDAGAPVPGNLFDNRVYSYGHRNPQGIAWDESGQLWQTEHGPSGFETGNDEFNKIDPGKNYGWPVIRGLKTREGMVTPVLESGRSATWAPAGLAIIDEVFYFAGLRGAALYEYEDPTLYGRRGPTRFLDHLKGEMGRLREVVVGPDGLLYITTSNRDGRGDPREGDDKILRVNPAKL